jgi:hypothetical protein
MKTKISLTDVELAWSLVNECTKDNADNGNNIDHDSFLQIMNDVFEIYDCSQVADEFLHMFKVDNEATK